jgi:hypothetical protein
MVLPNKRYDYRRGSRLSTDNQYEGIYSSDRFTFRNQHILGCENYRGTKNTDESFATGSFGNHCGYSNGSPINSINSKQSSHNGNPKIPTSTGIEAEKNPNALHQSAVNT